MSAPVVSIRNLSHAFGALTVLHELSLDIEPGEYLVLLGPSGSGKTTLLSILGGFLQPTKGEVLIDGRDCTRMPPAKRPTTTVFQDYALFPHMSVGANVAFGLRMNGVAKTERARQARETLALVGLEQALDKKPHQLSGGQRQRVALARALVNQPKVLLLDEPLGALDLKLRENMQEELKALQKALGITFVFVTHDQGEALSMADRVAVFNDGKIMQVGTPEEIYQRPATRFVADFVGSSNVLPPDFVQRWSGQHRWASLRPEAIRVGSTVAGEGVPARLVSTNYLGATTKLLLDAEGLRLHATVPAGAALPEPGEEVTLTFNREHLHLMEEGA